MACANGMTGSCAGDGFERKLDKKKDRELAIRKEFFVLEKTSGTKAVSASRRRRSLTFQFRER